MIAKERTPDLTNHAHYSELCSLAASSFAVSGQLSPAECVELLEHLPACPECQELMQNFTQVSFALLRSCTTDQEVTISAFNGLQRVSVSPQLHTEPATARKNADDLGMAAKRSKTQSVPRWAPVAASAVIIISLMATVAFQRDGLFRTARAKPSSATQPVDFAVAEPTTRATLEEIVRLKGELEAARNRELTLNKERSEHNDAVSTARQREAELNVHVAALERANAELSDRDSGRVAELAQLGRDLERMRSESAANGRAATLAQIEVADRSAEIKRLTARQAADEQQIATLKEAQDLIEGRRVHLWTVYQTNSDGKQQQAFGRVLYTEGERLIFYAYDLAQHEGSDTRLAFYVWGEKAGRPQPIKNLGILHVDDAKKKRWKLTFDDQSVLAQINSVFVTAEPSRDVATAPSGKKMLSASLEGKTDHP